MHITTVSIQYGRLLSLLVVVGLLLGMMGPAQVLAAPQALTPDLAPQAGSVTLDGAVGGTPTVDSTPTTGTANNSSSITFSHTTGSGNNRLLLVGVSFYHASLARTVLSVTFGGTALTSVAAATTNGNTRRVQIWRLIAPADSTTADVVVTFSGTGVYGVAGALSFAGVDQCTPLGTYLGATGNSSTATVSPVTVAGDLVFDTVAAGSALTVNGSQAQQWNTADGTTIYGGASTKTATTTPTPMSWTLGTSDAWAIGAVPIKPVNTAFTCATANSVSTVNVMHTTGTGTDRLMLVGVSYNSNTSAQTISSIKFSYGSGPTVIDFTQKILQKHSLAANYRYSSIWYFVNPPSGETGTVIITFSGSVTAGIVVGVANFQGANQTTPLGTSFGASSPSNNTTPTVTLTSLNGDELVFDTLFLGGNPPATVTATSGQTEVWNGAGCTIGNTRGAASTKPATASTTMSWTAASSSLWVIAAVPINPVLAGPTVTINQAAGQDDPTNASPIDFTVIFGEAVTGFETGDVTLSSSTVPGSLVGTVTEIAPNDGTTYNVAVSGMTGSGTVTANIAAGVAQNAGSQPNVASTSSDNTVTYDITNPSVTTNQASTQADPTGALTINFTVVFSEPVTDFATGDVALNGSAGATTAVVTGSGTTYNVAASGMTGSGTVIASIDAGVAHDAAGNPNEASSSDDNSVTYNVDSISPTVTVDQASTQADPTAVSPINFTVVFNESVTDFATGDVDLSGSTAPGTLIGTVTGSGTTYNVAVSGMTASGTIIASIAAGAAHDEGGNPNEASTSSDNTVTYAAVTRDGAFSSGTGAPNDSGVSFSHATGNGTNRLMLVGVSWNCGTTDRTISTITFTPDGGSALSLTEVKTQLYSWQTGTTRYTAIYSLLGPDSGVPGTVDITFSGAVSNGIIAGAANFAGVDQTTPLGTPNGAVGTGTSSSGTPNPEVTLTGLTGNELVFDSVFIGASSTSHTMTADSGQSELWNILGYSSSSTTFNMRGAASTKQAAGTSATMSWTTGGYGTTATRWVIAAVPIKPALDATPPETAIDSQPPDPSGSADASFTFSSSEAGSTFECQLDGGGYAACTSPKSYTGLSEGSHTFQVRATDGASNTDPTPASYTWIVDTLTPALAYVVANTTLEGDLDALTATFPASIPAVIVAEPYKINSRMTLADSLPAGSTVTILVTVNGSGPFPYVTNAPIPASPFWVTELFDPDAVPADFDAGYGGRIEVYSITINSGGGNPEAIDTTLKVESIISKDGFVTEEVLAVLDNIPVHVDADEAAALAYVVANTTLEGDLAALTATFPPSIPPVIVVQPYKINSRMTLADPLPVGSTVSIQITVNGIGPVPYVTNAPIPASPFWVTDLFDPDAVPAHFDAGYGGRIEVYSITINSGGGNPETIDTTVMIESIISKDGFVTNDVLAEIILPVVVVSAPEVFIGPTQLSWDPVADATSYLVHESTTDPYCEPGDDGCVSSEEVSPYTLPTDTSFNYYYFVRAVNGPVQSDNSNRVGRFSFQLVPGTEP